MSSQVLATVEFNKEFIPGRSLEVRRSGMQIRFYEVGQGIEICLKRDLVMWLLRNRRFEDSKEVKKYIYGARGTN
jgi:hypothetical protein